MCYCPLGLAVLLLGLLTVIFDARCRTVWCRTRPPGEGSREPNQGTIGDGLRHFPAGPVIRPSHLCAHSAAAPGEVMAWHFSTNVVRDLIRGNRCDASYSY